MKIRSALIETCVKELGGLLTAVDPANASPEHVNDVFHALMGWEPQSLSEEEDFDFSAVEAIELQLGQATRTVSTLGKYLAGDLS